MKNRQINLYSDTQSQPPPGMRQAMAEAEVGDEQQRLDPSVNRLCEEIAELLGKEAAVFLPSGTMCNQIAMAVHCEAGDEIIADETAHVITSEAGGLAVFAGAMVRPLRGENGIFTADQLEKAIRTGSFHQCPTRLVVVEQTSNRGGGSIWPLATLQDVSNVARDRGISLHMDGARLMNAVVASGIAAKVYTSLVDTAWLDLSKGLGCPVGGVLAGDAEFIEKAWRWKHRFGGAMRQAGILAAAGSWALTHHIDRLAEDHENARFMADRLRSIDGISLINEAVESNLVFFDVGNTGQSAKALSKAMAERGVRIGASDHRRMRAVTHVDIERQDIVAACDVLEELVTKIG